MEDKIDKIKRLTLDDIIDNDPIAEGIYERFITINGMRKWYYRNEGIEAILPDFGNDSPYLFTPMYEASFKGTKR